MSRTRKIYNSWEKWGRRGNNYYHPYHVINRCGKKDCCVCNKTYLKRLHKTTVKYNTIHFFYGDNQSTARRGVNERV